MKITSTAPTRIDIAGGTTDLWPLYLLIQDSPTPQIPSLTVNLGISLIATSVLESAPDLPKNTVTFHSQDLSKDQTVTFEELQKNNFPKELTLLARMFLYYSQNQKISEPLKLTTKALSPAGAGLGGSSALSISVAGALSQWSHHSSTIDKVKTIEIVRDIESQILFGPAGLQDFYGAAFGGLQSIEWAVAENKNTLFDESIARELSKRIVLFYSGKSRNSGINNWQIYKDLIDGKSDIRKKLSHINQSTFELNQALKAKNWNQVGSSIKSEWTTRKTLAAGITTDEIDQSLEIAIKNGATCGKVCGAGGGGCFFVYVESGSSSDRDQIIQSVTKSVNGVEHLDFEVNFNGLSVQSDS